MLKMLPPWARGFSFALVVAVLAAARPVEASSLQPFVGFRVGVMLFAAGTQRVGGNANVRAIAGPVGGKFTINGTVGKTKFIQYITLGKKGIATISPLLPTVGGDYSSKAVGTYSLHGRRISMSFNNPGGHVGTMAVRIDFVSNSATLAVSSVVGLENDNPIFCTIIAQ